MENDDSNSQDDIELEGDEEVNHLFNNLRIKNNYNNCNRRQKRSNNLQIKIKIKLQDSNLQKNFSKIKIKNNQKRRPFY